MPARLGIYVDPIWKVNPFILKSVLATFFSRLYRRMDYMRSNIEKSIEFLSELNESEKYVTIDERQIRRVLYGKHRLLHFCKSGRVSRYYRRLH